MERAADSHKDPEASAAPEVLLLFPKTSYRVDAYLEAAARAGVALTLGTDLPSSFTRYGRPVIAIDFARPMASAEAAIASSPRGFRGVLATNEASAVVAAEVATRLGLPHNATSAAEAVSDKRIMRERLASAGVPSPIARVLEPESDPSSLLDVRFPCVVKPTMLTGSQGVIRADTPAELFAAVRRLRAILGRHPSELRENAAFHRVIVEDYLPGVEVAVEALLTRGELRPLAIFDKPDDLTGPFFEETIYVTPSRLSEAAQRLVLDVTARAARALGLVHGPIHAELRVDGDSAKIVEVAARSIGGLCSRVFSFVAGPLEDLALRHAAGLPIDADPLENKAERAPSAGVMMIPIPRSGVLRGVSGLDEARAVARIEDVRIAIAEGEAVRALPEGSSYLGFIFARGESPAAVEGALREAHAALRFDLSPLLDLAF